jgi:hypothetical protein
MAPLPFLAAVQRLSPRGDASEGQYVRGGGRAEEKRHGTKIARKRGLIPLFWGSVGVGLAAFGEVVASRRQIPSEAMPGKPARKPASKLPGT